MAKQLNTRIQLKHDFESNWIKAGEKDFIPKSGEMIIYDAEVNSEGVALVIDGKTAELPEGRDTYYAHPRMKIGDGVTNVTKLPFSSSVSSGDGVNRTYDHRLYADGNDAYIMFQSYVDGELESDSADQIVISGSDGIGVSVDEQSKKITLSGNGSGGNEANYELVDVLTDSGYMLELHKFYDNPNMTEVVSTFTTTFRGMDVSRPEDPNVKDEIILTNKVFEASTNPPTNTNLLWIDTTSVTGGLKYYNGTKWVTVPVRFS